MTSTTRGHTSDTFHLLHHINKMRNNHPLTLHYTTVSQRLPPLVMRRDRYNRIDFRNAFIASTSSGGAILCGMSHLPTQQTQQHGLKPSETMFGASSFLLSPVQQRTRQHHNYQKLSALYSYPKTTLAQSQPNVELEPKRTTTLLHLT